jgi:hypothetical protein
MLAPRAAWPSLHGWLQSMKSSHYDGLRMIAQCIEPSRTLAPDQLAVLAPVKYRKFVTLFISQSKQITCVPWQPSEDGLQTLPRKCSIQV